jgi:hypothetical protein
MKNKLIFRFIVTFFSSVAFFSILSFLRWSIIDYNLVFLFSFITSFFYFIVLLEKKFEQTNELTKNNYWQLKNELKRKLNGKEKKNSGKQVL